jgi:hypothetical protein
MNGNLQVWLAAGTKSWGGPVITIFDGGGVDLNATAHQEQGG